MHPETPCPCNGKPPTLRNVFPHVQVPANYVAYICDECHRTSDWCPSEPKAAEGWNND